MSVKKTAAALLVAAITSIGLAAPAAAAGPNVKPACVACWSERAE